MQNYDRWYILAHSQGTVIAFNGLMETEQALPNYLSQELWEELKVKNPDLITKTTEELPKKMMPTRPAWLENNDTISRRELFCGFQGIMTYGSPLRKFAVLWPKIVPLNNDEKVFPLDCEWINIYDPTDPVADSLEYFDPKSDSGVSSESHRAIAPKNYAYRAGSFHLLSHINCLTFQPGRETLLVRKLADWLVNDGQFEARVKHDEVPEGDRRDPQWQWPTQKWIIGSYNVARVLTWIVIGLILGVVLDLGLWFFDIQFKEYDPSLLSYLKDEPKQAFWIILCTSTLVFVAGSLSWLWNSLASQPRNQLAREEAIAPRTALKSSN